MLQARLQRPPDEQAGMLSIARTHRLPFQQRVQQSRVRCGGHAFAKFRMLAQIGKKPCRRFAIIAAPQPRRARFVRSRGKIFRSFNKCVNIISKRTIVLLRT